MTVSNFTILLARQRSGTNPLRSILGTHADIFCFNEVFNFADRDAEDALLRETNYFNFIERYTGGVIRSAFPDRHETIFCDYLEYLRCFSEKPHLVLDVKHNTAHFLTEPWARDVTSPFLFDLITKYGLRVLHLRRRNYLRYVLSTEKAWYSGTYTVARGELAYEDHARWVNPDFVMRELTKCDAEDDLVARRFASYPRFLAAEYADIFSDPQGEVSPHFLAQFASWLDVPDNFDASSAYRKQSSLPLHETIENYAEVAAALQGTKFEYCLEDEPAYRLRARGRTAIA
jgi:hypothetical protein